MEVKCSQHLDNSGPAQTLQTHRLSLEEPETWLLNFRHLRCAYCIKSLGNKRIIVIKQF